MNNYNFDARATTEKCIEWIKNWFKENGPDCKAIVGISGGKDSSIVAALCSAALGKKRVIGVMMPNLADDLIESADKSMKELLSAKSNLGLELIASEYLNIVDKYCSAAKALNDGYKLCKFLGIEHFVININAAVTSLSRQVNFQWPLSDQTIINLPPRIRMSTLYAVAQTMDGRVANTSNLSEIYLGYGTRWGDTVGDFAPLANLTCTEVKKIGQELGLPSYLVNRVPDDGLCGKTDEESFGFTYAELDNYIRNQEPFSKALVIDEMHKKSEFKRNPIATFKFEQCVK